MNEIRKFAPVFVVCITNIDIKSMVLILEGSLEYVRGWKRLFDLIKTVIYIKHSFKMDFFVLLKMRNIL